MSGINEFLQNSWDNLSDRDRQHLLRKLRVKDSQFPTNDVVDDFPGEVRGRLILAASQTRVGFSIEEYHRSSELLVGEKPSTAVRMLRGVTYKVDSIFHPNLHK